MILRRLADGIKNQDWFVAMMEVMIVVVGIFIGLQVDDWNERRRDKARALDYLARITADLDADLAAISDRSAFWRDVAAYGAKGLSYAGTGEAEGTTQWDLIVAFFQASQVAEFITLQSTYDELKSAGELGLISDLDLRGRLAGYYNFTAAASVVERPAYREHVRGAIPLNIQKYIWENCYQSNQFGNQKMFDCDSPIESPRAREIVDGLVGDTALMSELRYWMSTMHVASLIARDRTISATAVRALVEAARNGE